MAYLHSTVWGPAEFVGSPPGWLVGEGILAGIVAMVAIVGTALLGAWTGRPGLADGEAGLVCVAAFVLYLLSVRAGRALIGITALLGVCLALHAPQAAAGVVLAERGRVQSVVVTSVEDGRAAGNGQDRYLCSVMDHDGVPLKVRIWRGCGEATRPGDTLAVAYDPKGLVPPRGAATEGQGTPRDLVPWCVAFMVASLAAVVRSYRLPGP
ncbi:hypothetical protein AV521_34750 [Streptomyces sp. IMTB 2501]|uniref:hypothetical protein n=1 Tax=Streptomyces sp. IMTB 2501 TaxID=1776340 RepID=UPI00096C7ECE|nr:hypothetical protein [Streptomyces sp. IMTB 2501]OLZ64582.1 hypothetical protein AV521_34750 [Streptomyces sp. IMTB 2501]